MKKFNALLFFLCVSYVLLGQVETQTTLLDTISIQNSPIPKLVSESTESISQISKKELEQNNELAFEKTLNRTTGTFMQTGTLSTNRITIRGIGARNTFGTVGIRAFFGDIPLTDGNSGSTIENLELNSLSAIQIIKGPSATSFGAGLGGTILLKPNIINKNYAGVQSGFGSFGLRRNIVDLGIKSNQNTLNIIYSNSYTDGFRENNDYNRNSITLVSNLALNKNNDLQLLANFTDLKAAIPSSLNFEDFTNNPTNAAFTWGASQGFEDVQNFLAGITWNHNYNATTQQKTTFFTVYDTNYEPRPFNILNENGNILGLRSRILKNSNRLKWALGGELFYENTENSTFENLYEDFPLGTGSVTGNQLSAFNEKRYYYNFFGEVNYTFQPKWKASLGVNVNQTFFRVEDVFTFETLNNEGNFDFNPIVSPKLGLLYSPTSKLQIFGTIAHGFNTPTSEETLLPDNTFNPNLAAETGLNFEIGQRYCSKNNKLKIENSIFSLFTNNLLVTRRAENDNVFAINAGKTRHLGIESLVGYTIVNSDNFSLHTEANATLNYFEFTDFVTDENDFSGNKLTGVPSHILNVNVSTEFLKYFYGSAQLQHVGEIPITDDNSVFNEAYTVIDTQLGFKVPIFNDFELKIVGGFQNATDQKYASQVQVNAQGFGGTAPRYHYPALPQNFYTSIQLKYTY